MADITSANIVLTIGKRGRTYAGRFRRNIVTLSWGSGYTYPVAGYISLPTDKTLYGLGPRMDFLDINIANPPIDGYVYKLDVTNMRLYIYLQTGTAAALTTLGNVSLSATSMTLAVEGN